MTWSLDTSNGFEARKVRFDALPYLARGGLDIGCGPEKVWPHMIGIDSGKDTRLFGVQMRPDITVPDAARLTLFADGAVESVFSSHTLEHIDDWTAALAEWWRVLKVGGHLVLYLPHADLYPRIGEPGANPDHKHDFTPADIIDWAALKFDATLLRNDTRGEGDEYSFLLVMRKESAGHGWLDPPVLPAGKTAGIVRLGGNGDALWAASVAAHLHDDGYRVTMICAANGHDVLRHDPHIAEFVVLPIGVLSDDELIAFYAHAAARFDRWVNLIGSVETRLLPHQSSQDFYLPHAVRHELMNRNYLDMVHTYAELPAGTPSRQRFYPSEAESKLIDTLRAEIPGPLVVLSPTGSGPFKAWPHAQEFMRLMADAGVYTMMFGDLQDLPALEPVTVGGVEYGHVIGTEWPLRLAMAMALRADAVVATESVIANAVAMADVPKVILLSHSSNENLTRDWPRCAALEAPVACHPCHRIHNRGAAMCSKDTVTGAAACMAHYAAGYVAQLVLGVLDDNLRLAA